MKHHYLIYLNAEDITDADYAHSKIVHKKLKLKI